MVRLLMHEENGGARFVLLLALLTLSVCLIGFGVGAMAASRLGQAGFMPNGGQLEGLVDGGAASAADTGAEDGAQEGAAGGTATQLEDSNALSAQLVEPIQGEGQFVFPTGLSYTYLPPEQQGLYEAIRDGVASRAESFILETASAEDIEAAYNAVRSDHPEFFWLNGASYSIGLATTEFTPNLSMAAEDVDGVQAQIEAKAAEVLDAAPQDGSTYDKVRYIYDWIIDNTDYDKSAEHNQDIQSVLAGGRSVCSGYSRAFQYLCHRLGIPCDYIAGEADGRGGHAWNLVDIDGTLTYVDVTWGDPMFVMEDGSSGRGMRGYYYFCVTSEEISRDHYATEPSADLPLCESTEYDYYRQEGRFLEVFSPEVVNDAISQAASEGRQGVDFKFAGDEAFQAAFDWLGSVQVHFGPLGNMGGWYYSADDVTRVVEIEWE